MQKRDYKAQSSSWNSMAPKGHAQPAVRQSVSPRILIDIESEEPSEEMMAKIKSVVNQNRKVTDSI